MTAPARCTCLLPVALMGYQHAVNCPANPAPPTWTCPDCGESTAGTSQARRAARRAHAKRHGTTPQRSAPAPDRRQLDIPPVPEQRRRVR